jgi:aminomethyltransferase
VWEAGLGRFCKMEKGGFVGRAALERAKDTGLTRTLVGLEMIDRGIARDGYKCFDESGAEIGAVTSGSPSPTLAKNIVLALIPPALAEPGSTIYIDIRGQKQKARVVPTLFYRRADKVRPRTTSQERQT